MSARDDQVLIEKLKSLPPQRRAEVEDFVDFLRSRETDQHLARRGACVGARVQGRLGQPRRRRVRPALTERASHPPPRPALHARSAALARGPRDAFRVTPADPNLSQTATGSR